MFFIMIPTHYIHKCVEYTQHSFSKTLRTYLLSQIDTSSLIKYTLSYITIKKTIKICNLLTRYFKSDLNGHKSCGSITIAVNFENLRN